MMEEIRVSERAIRVGENRIFLTDDMKVICYVNIGDIDEEIARSFKRSHRELLKLFEGKVNVLVDLNKAGKTTSRSRKVLDELVDNDRSYKLACFGAHPVAKIIASFFLKMSNKKDTRFFKNEEEALSWFAEDPNV
ncbi:MAG: hypothetical protein GY854_19155 [Deltaproteobacteria bacterium]|nr:hypothetical protein [Deltaproteobacteria bacterium]